MKIFESNISYEVINFFRNNFSKSLLLDDANQILKKVSGINTFFDTNNDLQELKEKIYTISDSLEEPDRTEYGDFQTSIGLADKVILHLTEKNISPEILIEPTCGKGNFIIASLKHFTNLKYIFGIEIYKPYVWETKFEVLNFFLKNPLQTKPEIFISHCDVFEFDFKKISKHSKENILIIGNPPWVTNSNLGKLNSKNLPLKSNFKNHTGIDAITGKANFDIAESIILTLLDNFQAINGHLVFLVKNSVIKNIVFDQKINQYKIFGIEKYCIDTKKEFNVSVEAAMFFCRLNAGPDSSCKEFDFYKEKILSRQFGWLNDKFVSNIRNYIETKEIDGRCQYEWRQGLKHDCSSIMEFNRSNGQYFNAASERINLEDDLVYGILKSSDLKNTVIDSTRKYTIVTQRKVGQDTKYIQSAFPGTYQYLKQNTKRFTERKSSIYKGKPLFSIFGIGDYSFKPYKVAISGLYKTFHFSLILPQDNKPIMLDDTCYFLGFDNLEFAVYTTILLNSNQAKEFLESITFPDAKRTFTKDVLMRINLERLAELFSLQNLETEIKSLNKKYNLNVGLLNWHNYQKQIAPVQSSQIEIFTYKNSSTAIASANNFP